MCIRDSPEGEECAVEPAPLFLRAAAPVASYFPPPSFGPPSRGTFNVPFTPDGASAEEQEARLRSNSYFEIPGVTAHEAYPGHHLHFASAQRTNALRQVLHSTYMVEGWGLYTEQMMGQHGFYLTKEAKLGQLSMRLFRAGRIVVDTSLHLGEMDIDEATTFMAERCGFPVPTAHREVLRYCSYPTQASSYLTGALAVSYTHLDVYKRQALHLAERLGVDEELGPQDLAELAQVHLGHEHLAVVAEDVAQIGREGVQVAQMGMGCLHATGPHPLHTGRHGGIRRAPTHQQQLRVARRVVDLERRDVSRDAGDLVLAQVHHALVVDPLVGDVAAAVGFLEATDAVLEAGQANHLLSLIHI